MRRRDWNTRGQYSTGQTRNYTSVGVRYPFALSNPSGSGVLLRVRNFLTDNLPNGSATIGNLSLRRTAIALTGTSQMPTKLLTTDPNALAIFLATVTVVAIDPGFLSRFTFSTFVGMTAYHPANKEPDIIIEPGNSIVCVTSSINNQTMGWSLEWDEINL